MRFVHTEVQLPRWFDEEQSLWRSWNYRYVRCDWSEMQTYL